jgi:hypothetical protein
VILGAYARMLVMKDMCLPRDLHSFR